MSLSNDDLGFVIKLLRESEERAHTKEAFLAIVSAELDGIAGLNNDDERRAAIINEARTSAENSARLTADLVDITSVEAAHNAMRACGNRLDQAPWRQPVRDQWPAPISHEVERLIEELRGRQLSTGSRLAPSTDSILLQMRDTFEVLIKFTAILLLRAISQKDQDSADWARRQMFRRLELGTWIGNLREGLKRANDTKADFPEPIRTLAQSVERNLMPLANGYSSVRNDAIGHGARALNPDDTAAIIIGCLETGSVKTLRGEIKQVPPLGQVLTAMVHDNVFSGLTVFAKLDDEEFDLTGAASTERWFANATKPTHAKHHHTGGPVLPVFVHLTDGSDLELAPLIAARECTQCGYRDVLFFDAVYDAKRGGTFDLLDFARGHKSRLDARRSPDLSELFGDLVPENVPFRDGDSLRSARVLEALDKARVDRNYKSPAYLRHGLANYLQANDRGLYWVQAPAHIGKTTFVQGLADAERGDDPIEPRFADKDGGKVIAYYCRKEYRTGLAGMLQTLENAFIRAYDMSENVSRDKPEFRSVVAAATSESFLDWVTKWRRLAEQSERVIPSSPLVIAIDGLDEADPPPASSPLQVLPTLAELPEGLYVVLTSRPVTEHGSPDFLRTYVENLYGQP